MRNTLRLIFGGCLALVVLALVACGGDDDASTDGGTNGGATTAASGTATPKAPATPAGDVTHGGSSDLFVANAVGALDTSVTRFEQDVRSVNARLSFNVVVSGFSVGANGFFLFQSPDQMYMNLQLTGDMAAFTGGEDMGPIEILLRDGTMYMNTPFTGWVSSSLDDLGIGADSYKKLVEGHSPLDYESLVKSIGGNIQDLGEETLDGRRTQHYRVNIDIASLMGAVTDALGSSGGASAFGGASATGTMFGDIWVEKDSQLPYRMKADGNFGVSGQSATMTMTVDFLEYNRPVNIPDAPENAKSFADAFGSLGQ
jgi:hypothetical protein